MTKQVLLVMSNPVAGREDDYNAWYNETHLPQVMEVPGFTAARRYRVSDASEGAPDLGWKYIAIYEIDSDDIAATMNELELRYADGRLQSSTAIQVDGVFAHRFDPLPGGAVVRHQAFIDKA